MPDPIMGSLSGYDVLETQTDGKKHFDGALDDVRYTIAPDGKTAEIYMISNEGKKTTITQKVEDIPFEQCGIHYTRHIMHFHANYDMGAAIEQQDAQNMRRAEDVNVFWVTRDDAKIQDIQPRVQTWFFYKTAAFNAALSKQPEAEQLFQQVAASQPHDKITNTPDDKLIPISKEVTRQNGEKAACAYLIPTLMGDFDGDTRWDNNGLHIVVGKVFTPETATTPDGVSTASYNAPFDARIGIEFSANHKHSQ